MKIEKFEFEEEIKGRIEVEYLYVKELRKELINKFV